MNVVESIIILVLIYLIVKTSNRRRDEGACPSQPDSIYHLPLIPLPTTASTP